MLLASAFEAPLGIAQVVSPTARARDLVDDPARFALLAAEALAPRLVRILALAFLLASSFQVRGKFHVPHAFVLKLAQKHFFQVLVALINYTS